MMPTIVIFGASGDLTSRKLIPALYGLYRKKRLPADTHIVGSSRTPFSNEEWRSKLAESTKKFAGKAFDPAVWEEFAKNVFYQPLDIGSEADFKKLAAELKKIEGDKNTDRLYYLATAPQFYEEAAAQLGKAGLADEKNGRRRIVIEKPFGVDLESAKHLNLSIHQIFDESQVYRIDHYLGKETVQNILVLRFANSIFEPIWNRNYIDHVQITVAEEVLVGRRGDYYDQSGIMRDMFQNHLLQLLMVTAMEAPVRYRADAVRDEKVKVLQAIRPLTAEQVAQFTLRGQYDGYLKEPGVATGSQTATFAAIRLEVDNWRWQGVPFYLRSGKGMSCRTTQIVIQFRQPPTLLFQSSQSPVSAPDANRLVIQVQPAEGIQLHFMTKVPDAGMQLRLTDLDFRFAQQFKSEMPEAYQRLLLDALAGDASLFARADEVELAWGIIDPILAAWKESRQPAMLTYEAGLWGPAECSQWIQAQGREWFDICPVLS
ncbi:MAG: glucose-6-phosphate dehydrogenase [Planctomycetota bacterium]|nr:glucose-6-phosphate dehydrogenase [Planctomycetota bacterium]